MYVCIYIYEYISSLDTRVSITTKFPAARMEEVYTHGCRLQKDRANGQTAAVLSCNAVVFGRVTAGSQSFMQF